jgi:uncharacterized protein (TIGR03792 family)
MVIEWLKFRVSSSSREKFIQKDAEVWTSVLRGFPGFLGKEVWINPAAPEEIVLVVRWETLQQWKSLPQPLLDETEQKFAQQMGDDLYQIIETGEYQIRKFPEVAI